MDIDLVITFLKKRIVSDCINSAFIFGSVARGVENSNDCDLFIITADKIEKLGWDYFLRYCDQLKVDFYKLFSTELNLTVNTIDEFVEGSEFKKRILKRPLIIIMDGIYSNSPLVEKMSATDMENNN